MDSLVEGLLEEIKEQLAKIDDCVEYGRSVPFSNRVSVDKTEIFDIIANIVQIIEELKKKFPPEIRSAVRVVGDKERIIEDAKEEKDRLLSNAKADAEMIIRAAEAEKNRILDEHTVSVEARAYAREIKETANSEIAASRMSANQLFIDLFNDAESMMQQILEAHIANSREIQNKYADLLDEINDSRNSLHMEE